MKLKYPLHYEVARKGYFHIEYLTSKGGWRSATGMDAGQPKRFRSRKSAEAAAKKHNATAMVYWLLAGQCVYNRHTIYGEALLPDM